MATRAFEIIRDRVREHPAVKAWRELQPAWVGPESIHVLQEGRKSAIYGLTGVGSGGSAVIAKRCRAAAAAVERTVYAEVLPRLPVTSPRYYGSVQDDRGSCWLFLEDVGGERYATSNEEHCSLAGRWLGLMHTSTTILADAAAAALTRVDIAAYWSVVRECWSLDLQAIRRLATVGQVFRFLAAISWVSPYLAYGTSRLLSFPMASTRALQASLSNAIRAAEEAA